MFFIDHAAKTTSFIDPRLPNDLPNIPVESAPPHLLLPNDPNATLLPPPPPKHHGASLTPPPISRTSGSAFDMPMANEFDNQRNPTLPTNKSSKEQTHLMPPPGSNSRRRSRSVGEEEISRENIEAVSDATSVLASATKASSTRSHNMATPTSPPIRGESVNARSPPIIQGMSPKPPSTYNGRVVAFLRQHNIIDILKEKSSVITSHKSLRDKVNMIRQDGCHALERLSCDVELIILLRYVLKYVKFEYIMSELI
jgi:hypothetical protein